MSADILDLIMKALVALVSLGLAWGGFFLRSLYSDFRALEDAHHEHGERLASVEHKVATTSTRAESIERVMRDELRAVGDRIDRLQVQTHEVRRDVAAMTSALDTIQRQLSQISEATGDVRERVARMEGNQQ